MTTVTTTRDGNGNTQGKVIVPRSNALDPRSGTLVQPFKRLVEEGFILELKVTFTPNGYSASGKPDARLAAVPNSGLTQGQDAPVGKLTAAADSGNLIPKKGTKVKSKATGSVAQPLPLKTLTKKDFEGTTDEQLIARMHVVASDEHGGTLIGRVRSAGRYLPDVSMSYQDWWAGANINDRALSLCQKKELAKLSQEDKVRLRGKQCPFRGTAEFLVGTASTADGEDADEQEGA
jgi:hypothetical protein